MGSVTWRRRRDRPKSYQVTWRLDDGSQGSKSFASKGEALELYAKKRLELVQGTWKGRQRGRLPFNNWADEWWGLWSSDSGHSPYTLQMAESRLRNHLRPFFGRRPVEDISPKVVRQWQQQLGSRAGYATVMACRSLLYRVLQHAEDEGAILANPLRKVPAPRRSVDPEVVLGTAKRRVPAPEKAGVLLAGFPDFWWDHIITLLGTGMRFGELAALRRRRVHLADGVVHVVSTRYQAGSRYGSGFKGPKSAAGVREIPLARQVAEAISRRLPPGSDPDDLVFTGPGGAAGLPRGTRTLLSRDNFHRVYEQALVRASNPAAARLRPPARRALRALQDGGPQTLDQVTARLASSGRPLTRRRVGVALGELQAAGLAVTEGGAAARCWAAAPPTVGPLDHLDLHGAHDLRHTFATWLEDEGIPARVIDELMGHAGGRHVEHGSRIGRIYRETTPEMLIRVVAAIEQRLAVVLTVANDQRAGSATRSSTAEQRHERPRPQR
jgi:integrase